MSINPNEFVAIKRSTSTIKKTLSFASYIRPMRQNDIVDSNGNIARAPMNILDKWSSIELSFAQVETKDGNKIGSGASGRIDVEILEGLSKKTDHIEGMILENSLKKATKASGGDEIDLSILNTTVNYLPTDMIAGKGKTVAQLAKEYSISQIANAASNLEAQAAKNSKYARMNQNQADALKVAMILEHKDTNIGTVCFQPSIANTYKADPSGFFRKVVTYVKTVPATDDGYIYCLALWTMAKKPDKFKPEWLLADMNAVESTGGYIDLYNVFKTPNVNKLDNDKLTKAYNLKIKADPTRDYPYRIELTTMRGKPIADGNGGVKSVGIDAAHAVDRKTYSMDLTSYEWTNAIYMACQIRNCAISSFYVSMQKVASNIEYQALQRARLNASVAIA